MEKIKGLQKERRPASPKSRTLCTLFDFSTVQGDTSEKYRECHPEDTVRSRLSSFVPEIDMVTR
ncbi:hypothetical protein IE4803_CH01445 [Rhizobium etli bv. phaseoli str. IE4803]|nr:hypothetical protein IE4803_CH01445 [Rhizobium etli bv. phaseoli str. IE4803]